MREEQRLLRDVPDAAPLRGPVDARARVEPGAAMDPDDAARAVPHSGDGLEEGRLAGA